MLECICSKGGLEAMQKVQQVVLCCRSTRCHREPEESPSQFLCCRRWTCTKTKAESRTERTSPCADEDAVFLTKPELKLIRFRTLWLWNTNIPEQTSWTVQLSRGFLIVDLRRNISSIIYERLFVCGAGVSWISGAKDLKLFLDPFRAENKRLHFGS